MHAKTLIAAVTFVTASGAAFAADSAPATAPAAAAASVAAVSAAAQTLNLPAVSMSASRSRADVRAEASDFVAHYKTTLATQLELANNVAPAGAH